MRGIEICSQQNTGLGEISNFAMKGRGANREQEVGGREEEEEEEESEKQLDGNMSMQAAHPVSSMCISLLI